jgi:nitroreductase
MQLDEAIKKRHSTRTFKSSQVDWRDLMDAIDAANQSPMAGNHHHIKFMIIQDKNTIKALAKHSNQSWISQAPSLIAVCADDKFLEEHYGERGRIYGKQQSGAMIQTLLLKLADLGIQSCWIGAFTDELIRQTLKIPSHIQVEALIPVGRENKSKATPPKRKKKLLEKTIFWDTWNMDRKPTTFEEPQRQ